MLYLAIVATVAVLGAFIVPVLLAPRRASPREQDASVSDRYGEAGSSAQWQNLH